MKRILMLLILAGVASYAPMAFSVPYQINYQGYLTHPDGSPMDTTVTMVFRLYYDSTGGGMQWVETHAGVMVQGGLFNVRLGETAPLSEVVIGTTPRWLGVTVGGNTEMTPRIRLISTAYSVRVATVDGANGGEITGKLNVGWSNTNAGDSAFVMGRLNSADGDFGTVSGGYYNAAAGNYSTVSGGQLNGAGGQNSTIGGGIFNNASDYGSTVAGGHANDAVGMYSSVGGGYTNEASGARATVAGGQHNTASGDSAAIGGGASNVSSSIASVVAGGGNNQATGTYSVVGGGSGNRATTTFSTVGGGLNNLTGINGYMTIGGGMINFANGAYATVPGGYANEANGNYSFAAGNNSEVSGAGSFAMGTNISCAAANAFVWSDGTGPIMSIGSSNTFSVKATNGTRIWTNSTLTSGVTIGAGGNAWVQVSDSTKKRSIRGLDTKDILNRFSSLPLKRWEYQSEDNGVEHIGPMAQDFWNAFHLGNEPLGISTIDADGVMMATIQQLCKEVEALRAEIQSLKAEQQATSNRN